MLFLIFGEGSANEQYCSQANVNNYRKLKARLKSSVESGTDLEYTDPETSATVKLSDDDIFLRCNSIFQGLYAE